MRHSIEPKDRLYAEGYGFSSSAKNIGTHATKLAKNLKSIFKWKK